MCARKRQTRLDTGINSGMVSVHIYNNKINNDNSIIEVYILKDMLKAISSL